MTCEPAASDWRIVAVVAEPEAKASANLACSSAAIAVSKLSLVRSAMLPPILEAQKSTDSDSSFSCTHTRQRAFPRPFAQRWLITRSEEEAGISHTVDWSRSVRLGRSYRCDYSSGHGIHRAPNVHGKGAESVNR